MSERLRLPGSFVTRLSLWVAIFLVFPLPVDLVGLSFRLEVLGQEARPRATTVAAALPQKSETRVPESQPADTTERVLLYLEKAEKNEVDPWFRDDIRIAWITTLYASRGEPEPHVQATRRVLGRLPDEVWPWIVAWRKAKLGSEYSAWYDDNANVLASPPKKPAQSERRAVKREDFGRQSSAA